MGDLLRGKNESQKTRPKVPINVWISLSLVEGNPQTTFAVSGFGVPFLALVITTARMSRAS